MAVDKLVDSVQLDAALTATANAIRSKTGSAVSLPWNLSTGFASAVDGIPSGGDTDLVDSLVKRTISGVYENSRVGTVGAYAFAGCASLTAVNFPSCTTVSDFAFAYCGRLQSAHLPVCTKLEARAFHSCGQLQSVSIPVCSYIGSYAFMQCGSLECVYLPACQSLSEGVFANNASLISLYLTGSSVCNLYKSNAFATTPFLAHNGSFYVPASLLTAYQSATNWTYFSSRFVGLTDEELAELRGEST